MDNTVARTVRLAEWIWNALDRDADRCRRSSVKQLEAVLAAYYRHETQDVDLDRARRLGSHEGVEVSPVTKGSQIADKLPEKKQKRRAKA